MSKVTREMIAAAHDVTMRHKIVLGHELLTEIYQAMDAKRKFVGLTDEDWKQLYDEFAMGQELDEFAEAIEANLKEKNQ